MHAQHRGRVLSTSKGSQAHAVRGLSRLAWRLAQVRNTQLFPFSAVGELTGQLGTSNRGLECTGTLIGPKHVVARPLLLALPGLRSC